MLLLLLWVLQLILTELFLLLQLELLILFLLMLMHGQLRVSLLLQEQAVPGIQAV